jgi:hypothetical protein
MKLETGNLKLDRHATYESLSYESRVIVDIWADLIGQALVAHPLDDVCALHIINTLASEFRLLFEDDAIEWIERLVIKWRSKTVDVDVMSEAIALRIFKQRI